MTTYTRRQFAKVSAAAAATVAAGGLVGQGGMLAPGPALADEAAWDGGAPAGGAPATGEPAGTPLATLADVRANPLLLAVFQNSDHDSTDTFYVTFDGLNFCKISSAFENLDKNSSSTQAVGSHAVSNGGRQRTWNRYAFTCPSIIYKGGVFWMLANEANGGDDGTLRLAVSGSRDLVHWCDQRQVKVQVPAGYPSNGASTKFDAVAADWAVGPDGNVYVAVSLGRYGAFHGEAERDTMSPYLVRVTQLEATDAFHPELEECNNDGNYIRITCDQARPIVLPLADRNRIDGSWYFEGQTAYLSIKRNGVTNEIWSIPVSRLDAVGQAGSWTSVCSDVVTGYEAPCLTKQGSTYYYFTDELATWTPDDHVRQPYLRNGTHMQKSTRLNGGWSAPARIQCKDSSGKSLTMAAKDNQFKDGPRHGTVTCVSDPDALAVIWAAYDAAGWGMFTDTPKGAWYYPAVVYCAERGIVTGYDNNTFRPTAALTRAQAATMFWRYFEPLEAAVYANVALNRTGLPDVEANKYYTAAANWAVRNQVIAGSNGRFSPTGAMTREMFCQVLANAAQHLAGIDTSLASDEKLRALSDAGSVKRWYRDAVVWATDAGIMNGSKGAFKPGDPVTRAQMCQILMNIDQQGIFADATGPVVDVDL